GVTLPVDEGLSAGAYLDLAGLAEDCGYTDVLVGEVAGPEVFAMLGMIGASSPIVVEQWHGLGFDAPRARIEEYVAALRTVFRGERTAIDGTHVRSHGFRAALAPVDVPIVVA